MTAVIGEELASLFFDGWQSGGDIGPCGRSCLNGEFLHCGTVPSGLTCSQPAPEDPSKPFAAECLYFAEQARALLEMGAADCLDVAWVCKNRLTGDFCFTRDPDTTNGPVLMYFRLADAAEIGYEHVTPANLAKADANSTE